MDSEDNKDAELMRKAMEGFGKDDKALIEITTQRNNKQRLKIRQAYKAIYGRDLMEDLKKELSGHYLKTMLALFTEPIEYDVDSLYTAMKGLGTDEDCLIEILASRPGWYINKIKKKYKEKYKK